MDLTTSAAGAAARVVDPTAAEATRVAGKLMERLLGPTVDVYGEAWAEKARVHNLQKLLKKTQKRATASGNEGATKARLAAAAFDSVQYSDDEIITEYVSGVLASSRSDEGGTDAGLPWTALISRLSSLQLRLHYLLYREARPLVSPLSDHMYQLRDDAVVMSMPDLFSALGLAHTGTSEAQFADAMFGLFREGLIDPNHAWGSADFFEEQAQLGNSAPFRLAQQVNRDVMPEVSVRYEINPHGVLLYLWGLGAGAEDIDSYLDEAVTLEAVDPDEMPAMVGSAVLDSACWQVLDRESGLGTA
jgi:hypothetical protein